MSLAEGSSPTGVPLNWRQAIWPAFEIAVLQIICDGCRLLRSDPLRQESWEERHYSWALCRHLRHICRKRNLSFSPQYDDDILSDAEFAEGMSPKSAPKLDIAVRWHHLIPEIYFGVEAKILVTTTVRSYTRSKTVIGYVDDGMVRYVAGKYAAELPTGSMIGYVLDGDTTDLVDRINGRIKNLPLPCEEPLAMHSETTRALPRYCSNHPRGGTNPICLHHFFVLL